MRPYRRQHHGHSGRSNQPHVHRFRPHMEHQGQNDPDYIAYLRQKANHYNDRLVAMSLESPMPRLAQETANHLPDLLPEPPVEPPFTTSRYSTHTTNSHDVDTARPSSRASGHTSIPTTKYEKYTSDKWLTNVIPTQVSLQSNVTNSSDTDVGRVGGQSFLYFSLHSDYVSDRY